VRLNVLLGGVDCVVARMSAVRVSEVCMMSRLGVLAGLMMLGRLGVVLSRQRVMMSCVCVVVRCFL
jgi:hypothetical protein